MFLKIKKKNLHSLRNKPVPNLLRHLEIQIKKVFNIIHVLVLYVLHYILYTLYAQEP